MKIRIFALTVIAVAFAIVSCKNKNTGTGILHEVNWGQDLPQILTDFPRHWQSFGIENGNAVWNPHNPEFIIGENYKRIEIRGISKVNGVFEVSNVHYNDSLIRFQLQNNSKGIDYFTFLWLDKQEGTGTSFWNDTDPVYEYLPSERLIIKDDRNFFVEENSSGQTAYFPAANPPIGNTTGFITIAKNEDEYPDTLRSIFILNKTTHRIDDDYDYDDIVWMTFAPDYHAMNVNRDGQFDLNFHPWAFFESWTEVLVMRCVGETESSYLVIVNEELGWVKHLMKHKRVKYSTITEHLLEVPFIEFNIHETTIREFPSDDAKVIDLKNTYIGEWKNVAEVDGDWIKIQNKYVDEDSGPATIGWIKWRENGKFAISMIYSY